MIQRCVPLWLPLLLAPALSAASRGAMERQVVAMGTRLTLALEGPSQAQLEEATGAVLREVERVEAACSTWRPDSPWSRLNRAAGAPVAMAPEWLDLLATALDWSARTGGAFDPALQPLMAAWGIRDGGRTPVPQALAAARSASGAAQVILDRAAGSIRLLHPAAGLEEGGFLKGYALDTAKREALGHGCASGLLNFGGQVLIWGRPRRVAIADPLRRNSPRLSVWLRQGSVSSSSCSERGRHILDPRTGEPCPAWGAVSVVADDGLSADILSTALYVLGPREGLRWAAAHHVAAVFLPVGAPALLSPAFRKLQPVFAGAGQ